MGLLSFLLQALYIFAVTTATTYSTDNLKICLY